MKKPLHSSLFIKIAAITVVSLIVTNVLSVTLATEVTKRLFVDSFTLLNNEILHRVSQNFADYNTQTVSIVNAYSQNQALKECMTETITDQRRLFRNFYDMKSYMKSAEATSIFPTYNTVSVGTNNMVFTGNGTPVYTPQQYQELPVIQLSRQHPDKLFYRYSPSGLVESQRDKDVVIAAKQLVAPYSGYSFGSLMIVIDEPTFFGLYEDCVSAGSEAIVLSSSDGVVVSSSNKSLIGQPNLSLLGRAVECVELGERYIDIDYNGSQHSLIARYLPTYDMYIVNLVDKSYLLQDFARLRPYLVGGCTIVIAIATALAFYVARRVTKPLNAMVSSMSANRGGHFVRLHDVTGSYEVRELQHSYNEMVDEVDGYIRQLLEEQKQRRRSEIAALQMQINPHFLYNTLASIKYLSWQGDKDAVADTINSLIRLLQGVVGSIEETITVEEELENLRCYVNINHIRYGDGIKVYYNADPACLDCHIPRLVIQPFIENSFFHAFQTKREGRIHIFIKQKDDLLVCEVIDDGDGMSTTDLSLLHSGKDKNHFSGIGIRNVDERLKLIYGTGCGVQITSELGVGTTVTITMKRS